VIERMCAVTDQGGEMLLGTATDIDTDSVEDPDGEARKIILI
jgi:hypothetical protein